MKLIGLTGKKRSGKDAVFKILDRPKVARAAFADNLKREVAHITGFPVWQVEEEKESLRLLLQAWGADFRRKFFGEDYWIKAMDADLQNLELEGFETAIITDVRYPNEADYIKGQGGTVVRVVRGTDSTDQHSSETAMDKYPVDFTINNCGTLGDLAVETNRVWEEINGVRR